MTYPRKGLKPMADLALSRKTYPLLERIVTDRSIDVINVHFPVSSGPHLDRFYREHTDDTPRLVVSLHGNDILKYAREDEGVRERLMGLCARSESVTACSSYLASEAENLLGVTDIIPIPNGVTIPDLEPDRNHSDPPSIFSIGRLVHKKGFDLLIDAFATISDDIPHHLTIAGDGEERESLMERVSDLGLHDRIHLPGRISNTARDEAIDSSSCFVIPSRQEPFGIVVLEGMSRAATVVATNVGGIPEIVTEGTGILVEASIDGLVDGLRQALNSDPTDMGTRARERVEANFSLERMLEAYGKVLGAHP